jgi:hypothetical protein
MGRETSGRVGRGGAEDARLAELRERITRWRSTRATRAMPEELWSAAAELARAQGVHAVASALGLNHRRLKERCGECGEEPEEVAPAFLEVPVVAAGVAAQSVVELSRSDGARMTIRVAHALDVAELSAAFLGRRR